MERKRVTRLADLFTLTPQDLDGLDRMGTVASNEKKAGANRINKVLDQIRRRREQHLWRVIVALGIRHIGETTARDIAGELERRVPPDQSGDWGTQVEEAFRGLSVADLTAIGEAALKRNADPAAARRVADIVGGADRRCCLTLGRQGGRIAGVGAGEWRGRAGRGGG